MVPNLSSNGNPRSNITSNTTVESIDNRKISYSSNDNDDNNNDNNSNNNRTK